MRSGESYRECPTALVVFHEGFFAAAAKRVPNS